MAIHTVTSARSSSISVLLVVWPTSLRIQIHHGYGSKRTTVNLKTQDLLWLSDFAFVGLAPHGARPPASQLQPDWDPLEWCAGAENVITPYEDSLPCTRRCGPRWRNHIQVGWLDYWLFPYAAKPGGVSRRDLTWQDVPGAEPWEVVRP